MTHQQIVFLVYYKFTSLERKIQNLMKKVAHQETQTPIIVNSIKISFEYQTKNIAFTQTFLNTTLSG